MGSLGSVTVNGPCDRLKKLSRENQQEMMEDDEPLSSSEHVDMLHLFLMDPIIRNVSSLFFTTVGLWCRKDENY